MSFQPPGPWKRKLSRISNCVDHVWWGMAGFPLPVDGQPAALPFPGSGTFISSPDRPGSAVLHPAKRLLQGRALLWRVPGTCFSSYLDSRS